MILVDPLELRILPGFCDAIILHRHYISLSLFPRDQEFLTAGSCQVAMPSCASGKVDKAHWPLLDEDRLRVLHDANEGYVFLFGFAVVVL